MIDPYRVELSPPLQALRIGSTGAYVRRLQEWLGLTGTGVGIDEDFGPATEAAVKARFSANGAVSPAMWPLVCAPLERATATKGSGPFGNAVVEVASAHLAQQPREAGGDNKGPWVRHYCRGYEVAWCQGFASSMWLQASTGETPLDLVLDGIWCLYVPRMVTEAKAKEKFISGDNGRNVPAGSMFFVRGGSAGYVHVGIVTRDHGDTFETIEGNTNHEGGANGYEVCRRIRRRSSCDFGSV